MSDERDSGKLAGMACSEALQRLANTNPLEVTAVTNASMKDSTIDQLIDRFEAAAQLDENGVQFWRARDLAKLLAYSDYRNFLNIVDKAKIACANTGQRVEDHFVDVTDMVDIGSGATRPVDDIRMTRYACYLTAQNGDSRKKPVAFAQTYFAIQTRRQEIRDEDEAQYVPSPKIRSACS
jgi:DNA-damage-inducible protein D